MSRNHTISFIQKHLSFDYGFLNVGCGITKRSRHVARLYRFASKMQLWASVVLVLSNIPSTKVCLLASVLIILADLENDIYTIHLQNNVDTPSEDVIVGFGCFSVAC